jgi:hypothetical protein
MLANKQKTEVAKTRDDLFLIELWELVPEGREPVKVQLRVRRNSYEHQSHALAEVWDGKRWNQAASIIPANMQTSDGYIHNPTCVPVRSWFAVDIEELLERVKWIVR